MTRQSQVNLAVQELLRREEQHLAAGHDLRDLITEVAADHSITREELRDGILELESNMGAG